MRAPKLAQEPLEPAGFSCIQVLLATCTGNFLGLRDRAVLLFLMDTGTQAAEFLALNLEDIDLVTGTVFIRQGKGRKPRMAYIGKKTRKVVRQYLKLRRDNIDALWVNDAGERLAYFGLRSMVAQRDKQAGVDAPPPHAFRRAFALSMLRAGGMFIARST